MTCLFLIMVLLCCLTWSSQHGGCWWPVTYPVPSVPAGGTLAVLSKSSTENTLHVKIRDNLLHSLSDLNDTTCPWPLRGTVGDLAAFVVAGGALSCYYDSWGCRRWRQSCRVGDLRWLCGLSIYHDRFTCVYVIVLCNFICKCILCISIE